MDNTDTITEQVLDLADKVRDELDETYELVHVDYRDKLTDEQVGYVLAGDTDRLYESTMEWESDSQWQSACEVVEELAYYIAGRDEFDDEVMDEFRHSDSYHELVGDVRERDVSDPIGELISHTPAPLVRVELDTPSMDGDGCLPYGWVSGTEAEDIARELGIGYGSNQDELRQLKAELDWPDHHWAFLVLRADLGTLWNASPDDVVAVENPHVWLTNVYQGDGYMIEVAGTFHVKRSDIMTDADAPGYSCDDVHGGLWGMGAEVKVIPAQNEAA